MIYKPIMILPLALAGILILAVLTAIPSNNHAFAFGNSFTFASPTSSEENNNSGNAQESSNAGNEQQQSNSTGNEQQQSNNAGNAQESSNAGNATSTGVPENATSPSGSTASNNTGNASADFVNSILEIHKRERAAVSVPPLVWSDRLAADAKTWAEHIATTGEFVHSLNRDRPGEGESMNKACVQTDCKHETTAERIQGWVDENKNYHGGVLTAENWYPTGHYTQMVWNTTKEIGCATASGGGFDYLVCRYSPPGNIIGQKPY
jgi:uncharacterized protein YkwD